MSHSNRTWRDNAEEFAALDRGEGWQFAILVACSVEPLKHGGKMRSNLSGKVTAEEFATVASTAGSRVRRYLDAWQQAAEKGWVPEASTLTPEMARDLPIPAQPWRAKDGGVYDASRTGGQINNTQQIADKAARDPEYAARIARDVVAAMPETAKRQAFVSLAADADVVSDAHTRLVAEKAIDAAHAGSPVTKALHRAEKHEEATKKQNHTLRYAEAQAALDKAYADLRQANTTMQGVSFTDEERDLLGLRVTSILRLVEAMQTDLAGDAVDWDNELARMAGGER